MATLRHSGLIAASALLLALGVAGCASGENTSPGDTFATGQLNGGDRNTVPQVTYLTTSPDSALKRPTSSSRLRFWRNIYSTPRAWMSGPKTASSTGIEVLIPT